jgi:hypothetical protein
MIVMTRHFVLGFTVLLCACTPFISPTSRAPEVTDPDRPAVVRERLVDVSPAALTERVKMTLFPGTSLSLVRDELRQTPEGTVWVGHVRDQPGSSAIFVVREQVVVGNITTRDGRVYELRYAGNGVHRVREVDPSRFPPEGPPDEPAVPPRDPQGDPCPSADPPDEIDVMVVYNQASRVAAGGTEAMEAEVVLAIEATNQGYINSDVLQRVNLVHTREVDYAETGSSITDRNRLQNPSDGFIDDVHDLRDQFGADIVVLITNTPTDFCGFAYIMTDVSTAFEPFAFANVVRSCSVTNLTFPHELGHIMGARHDWGSDATNNSPFEYNHGHVRPNSPILRTILALGAGTRVQWFSNPNLDYPGTMDAMGVATGTQQADNRRTLNETAFAVANFRCSSPGSADVWAKDTWNDTGAEPDPNTAGEPMWKSPYIWVRNDQDATLSRQHMHQNPVGGVPNFVYVKLHNGGLPTSGELELHFADASTGLAWPGDWTLIASTPVAAFAGNTTRVVEVPWTPTLTGHACLLARWVSPDDPMTHPEGPNIGVNVRNNNNIVWRNVNVIGLGGDVMSETARLRVLNVDSLTHSFSLVLRTPDGQRHSFLREGEVLVVLDAALAEAWEQGGSRSTGVTAAGEALRVMEGGSIDNLILQGRQGGHLQLTFRRTPATPRRAYQLDVVQIRTDQGSRPGPDAIVVGGVSYEIRADISHLP